MVTTPDGLRIGYDPTSDTVVNEIAEQLGEEYAEYSGKDTEHQLITILDPDAGEYLVSASGTGTGDYKIIVQSFSANNTLISDYEVNGTASSGSQYSHEIELREDHTVIPEFPSLILPLFMIATLLAVIIYMRKPEK